MTMHDHHHHSRADTRGLITDNKHADGVDRRGFLKCMAWAGTGMVWAMGSGVLSSRVLGQVPAVGLPPATGMLPAMSGFTFAQISDSHIGFNKPANPDVTGTFSEAIKRINALPVTPDFLLHTGDLSHLSEPEEFDTVQQMLQGCKVKQVFYVPGEHDVLNDDGAQYRARFAKGTLGSGWYSFDKKGVHFVGLVNVMNLSEGGLGIMGPEQLAWLEKDLAPLSSDTPLVVFAHIPLWSVYPAWGWGTSDGAQALSLMKRFGSVSVLNGHIHQTVQKIEGNMFFHTARSTAFVQPAPGQAPKPGPMAVPAPKLRSLLGLTEVTYVEHDHPLAVVDATLADPVSTTVGA